ncbi:hypothetical protein OOK39_45430 [Streptomyces sp. NBC_00264]|nr:MULTISPECIES: hypothetical protein [unclassified Streptomyces]MCX5166280.1 hypothetical protein [Streptomyces sp. NBC_00305]MCX5224797.1 hypothetical protein [Streptomyces sp. NBC_00264]
MVRYRARLLELSITVSTHLSGIPSKPVTASALKHAHEPAQDEA